MFIIALYIFCVLLWGASFLPELGLHRSAMLALSRGLWLLPLLLSLSPVNESRELPKVMIKTPIHVFIDDSESMKGVSGKTQSLLEKLNTLCKQYSCDLKETYLSQENALTKAGYSPLHQSLAPWFVSTDHEAWIVISDGGDSTPNLSWPSEWSGLGQDSQKNTLGYLIGVRDDASERLWIENVNLAPVSFENRSSPIDLQLKRKRTALRSEYVQVQVRANEKVLLSENVLFPEGETDVLSTLMLPPLSYGRHEIEIKVLAPPGEKILWDKVTHVSVDVISNTMGVLHLLGSPSWDGRFLRRYLKSEPKYNLISFFILRDPWDMQAVDERELSLIPFPVARLFNEELKKFRTVILQDFNLLQFLSPVYQRNLVEYVKAGGSLLFIGGRRALQSQDLRESPLRELLPFDTKTEGPGFETWGSSEVSVDKTGPWFDKDLAFHVALARPSVEKLALADVYEEWSLLSDELGKVGEFKGMHHTENVKFRSNSTPLLDAVRSDGKRTPLAVASYPGKGRAIWIFSDQFWRLATNPQSDVSRTAYNSLVESSFLWLLRHDFRKPLAASNFQVQSWGVNTPVEWSVELNGPAVRYFEPGKRWQVTVCSTRVDLYKSQLTKMGTTRASLRGRIESTKVNGKVCALEIRGEDPAFGSLSEIVTTNVQDLIKDQSVGVSELKMRQLAELTGAQTLQLNDLDKTLQSLETWIVGKTGHSGVIMPARFRSVLNYYWIFDSWWYFFLLIFLPIEVVIRRWHKLKR